MVREKGTEILRPKDCQRKIDRQGEMNREKEKKKQGDTERYLKYIYAGNRNFESAPRGT